MKLKGDMEKKGITEFRPKQGQIDYTNVRRAPVINCVVAHGTKILLVQRNSKMKFYPNYWNGISGFFDDNQPIEQKVKEELQEELEIGEKDIISIQQGETFKQEEPRYGKTWIVHPFLIELNTDIIKLDWEAQDCRWIEPPEAKNFNLLPGFKKVLGVFHKLIS